MTIRRAVLTVLILLGTTLLLLSAGALTLNELRRSQPLDLALETSAVVLDRNGQLLRAFTVDDGRWRLPVSLGEVDPLYLRMLLGYEDQRFWQHAGVDLRALLRAAWQALRQGRIVSGGSTLTMQVVRLRLGLATGSLEDKWRQLGGALALERVKDKHQVLEAYLNLAPFGGNLEGVRAASLAWLGREPRRLTPAQAALLVALPQAPEQRRPDRSPEAARLGRDRVLSRAEALGLIDADTAAAARREPIPIQRRAFPMLAPHLARRALTLSPAAGVHRLTLDARLQARLQRLAAEHAARLPDAVSVAILVVDHGSGEVLASVGSAGLLERERDGFVDMTGALRSPGSTLKPLIYGLAFELGLAHPESLIEDRPRAFGGYVPENFDRGFQGTVTVRAALQQSLNVPAVTLLERVGPARLLARLRRAGAEPHLPKAAAGAGLAIGLGGVGLSLTDLVSIYAAIARGGDPVTLTLRDGLRLPESADRFSAFADTTASVASTDSTRPTDFAGPTGHTGLSTRTGTTAERNPVLPPRAAWYLASILSGAERLDQIGGAIALKTGTSYGYRDAWALGFDGKQVIGVWSGRPDGAAVPGLTGTEAAVPILRDAFARLDDRVPLPGPPFDVLMASSAELPPPLRRVDGNASGAPVDRLEIAFPPDGAVVDLGLGLGLGLGGGAELALKVRNGSPPFQWLANGRPIAHAPHARSVQWRPEGPGFATIAVIDGQGQSSRVSVSLQ
ncbi:penicillin-binding protein 1C [Lamprobacter modestohalophilus]|uniref:peptidoglycan glycosyltransferase n=1 Tax=Lamprobacter modestohalophilus TaxID=1064514 RepID=A0A9X0WC45_9GAMM|nr:penicillin-binding protein 1C [Lamprobacter modestohalophilus]MBK1620666.1 penicillin-binding protein 1C [Lamprobacter modestohalophilus]